MIKDAVISDCGKYRYVLTRIWDTSKPVLLWCMLNPSTADASVDDPTIRKCVGFAKRWGYGGIVVVNLFAYRATKPGELATAGCDVVGPHNDVVIIRLSHLFDAIVAAWGVNGDIMRRDEHVLRLWQRERLMHKVFCLTMTHSGYPRHPLMPSYDVPLIPFVTAAA